MSKQLKRILIDVFIIIIGTIIATVILNVLGIGKEKSSVVTMNTDEGNNIQINSIEYKPTVNFYTVSATDIASGATVTIATPDLVKVPEAFKYPIESYLKSHNLTKEELRR